MSDAAVLSALRREIPGLVIKENEILSSHCSFRIGGACKAMLLPDSAGQVSAVCRVLKDYGEEPILLGNGTNVLFSDSFIPRFVLKQGDGFSQYEFLNDNTIRANAGITLSKLAVIAAEHSLSGLEFAHGIPGSLGGAVFMNAGAYGGEMKDVVTSVTYLDETGREATTTEPDFSYRHSLFSDGGKIVLSATVTLTPGVQEEIRLQMRTLMEKRRNSQPLNLPSAGSTFKRPVGGYAAALIDQAGLKGYAIGGAQVSEKHAGFVVNRGGASFDDVMRLIEYIQKTVMDRTGIRLEPEVRIIRG